MSTRTITTEHTGLTLVDAVAKARGHVDRTDAAHSTVTDIQISVESEIVNPISGVLRRDYVLAIEEVEES